MFFFYTCNAVAAREDRKPKYWRLRAPPSWIEFDAVTSNSKFFRLCNATWIDYSRLSNDFSGFYKRSINAGTWKSQATFKMSCLTVWRHNVKLNPRWRRPSQYFGFRSSRAATALRVSKKNITFCFNQG